MGRVTPFRLVHYAGLVVGGVLVLALIGGGWFFSDDFAFLVPSLGDLLAPHVGHWSTAPHLLFLLVRDLFGLDSYLPFAVPSVVAHLAFVHLLWRFLLRVGVAPWLATAGGLLLTFFGGGAENIGWAFQVGFVGAMALVLGCWLLALRARFGVAELVAIPLLATLALTFSGTALPLLAGLAALLIVRRGWRAALILLVPAAAYGTWWLAVGRSAPAAGRAEGVGQLLTGVPEYALAMLTDGIGRIFPIAVLGPLLFAAVGIGWVLSVRSAPRRALPAYLLFLVAPLFALATAYSRVGTGLETATSSRYLYFVVPMILPLALLGLTRLVRSGRVALGPVAVLVGILTVYNAGGLVATLLERRAISLETERSLSAALDLALAADPPLDPSVRPLPETALDVQIGDLLAFHDAGWFSGVDYPAETADLLRERLLGIRP